MMERIDKEIPDKEKIVTFRNKIIRWFNKNGRRYPWRETKDPFKILIAEMMLQRTKADQVESVYRRFFSKFSSPEDVAVSNMETLNEILFSLGLKWRIKKFKEVSIILVNDFNGKVPKTRESILKLPGVGDYVAGIVLSTAFNKKEWIVDSNVVRVFKRYFGIRTSKEGRRDKHVVEIAKEYASCRNPGKANMGILDFAALVCTPSDSKCRICPLSHECASFRLYLSLT